MLARVDLSQVRLLIAAILCLISPPAFAAPKPAMISSVDFGYSNAMPMERWAPIRVTITSTANAFSGRLVMRYRQDSTQSQVVAVPASVGPGASVPVEIVANFPEDPDLITVILLDDRDREVDRASYGRLTSNQPPGMIPYAPDIGDGLIGCVGRVSAANSVTTRWLGRGREYYYYAEQAWNPPTEIETVRMQRGARLHAVGIDPANLSTSWAAFDSLEALIVRSEEVSGKVNEDSRHAVMQWVQAGGRLVIEVDQVGDSWRMWLPPDVAEGIEFGDVTRLACPQEVENALKRTVLFDTLTKKNGLAPLVDPRSANPQAPDKEPRVVQFAEMSDVLKPAARVPGRTIAVSSSLIARGWTTEWMAEGKSLIAHGPVGFGYVSIVGCDPALAAQVPSNETSYRLWLEVLRAPLEDWLSLPDVYTVFHQGYGGFSNGQDFSGANEHQRQAVVSMLNTVADEPSRVFNPIAVLATVFVSIACLAIFIGPVDGFVLKLKSLRHVSWLTALAWIAGMSIFAVFAPRLLRGDLKTLVLRDRVIDQIDNGAAWSASATGFFSGGPGDHPLQFPSPGAFVRGASAMQEYGESHETLPPIRTAQGYTIVGPSRIACSNPQSLEQGQWTFRTLIDEGPCIAEEQLKATAQCTENEVQIEVVRAGPATTQTTYTPEVRSATLRIGTRTISMRTPVDQPTFSSGVLRLSATGSNLLAPSDPLDWVQSWGVMNKVVTDPAGNFPGAQRRRLGIEARLRGGKFALLTVVLADREADVVAGDDLTRYHSIRTYRMLIPIAEPAAKGVAP